MRHKFQLIPVLGPGWKFYHYPLTIKIDNLFPLSFVIKLLLYNPCSTVHDDLTLPKHVISLAFWCRRLCYVLSNLN